MSPPEIDACEMWQFLGALGVHKPKVTEGLTSKRDLVAERMAAQRGEAPPPVPDEPDASMQLVMARMSQG